MAKDGGGNSGSGTKAKAKFPKNPYAPRERYTIGPSGKTGKKRIIVRVRRTRKNTPEGT